MAFIALSDLGTVSSTAYIIINISQVPAAAIPCFISMILMMTTVLFFMRYFCVDNYDNRRRLVLGCKLMMIANAITFFGILIAVIASEKIKFSRLVRMFPTYVLPIFLWAYYSVICS